MTGVETFASRDACDAPVVAHGQGPAKIFFAPAQAEHLVVRGPVGERVVASVPDVDAAAVADERLEVLLDPTWPGRASAQIVVGLDDDVVVRKPRPPGSPLRRLFGRRRRRHRNGELTGGLEDASDQGRRQLPVVVAEPVDDEYAYGRFSRGSRRSSGRAHRTADE